MTVAEPTTLVYKQVGDLAIKLDLYRPAGSGPFPVVVWLHGGALIGFSRTAILERRGILEALLGRRMAVAAIDYRLAPETRLPEILTDVQDAFGWVQAHGGAHALDPGRVGVVGLSAGGYLSLMSAWTVRPRPQAIVSYYGYGDITGDWYARPDPFYNRMPRISDEEAWSGVGQTPVSEPEPSASQRRMRFYLWTRQRGVWPTHVAGTHPLTDPAAFGPWLPLRNVDADWPPTLLLHGTADTDVPFEQSVLMEAALTAAGVSARLITLAGAPHVFDRGITQADLAAPAAQLTPVARACLESVEFLARRLEAAPA
ncbi:MAG: alpha/beta hydrolase [Chloroflexi bacterium]|nr:alpha/beta hydrolase [Chloroflexota bacterium]